MKVLIVYFLENRGRGLLLRAAPIDVSAILRDVLFDRMKATVLTSATLTVDGTFDFVRSRLGLEKSGKTQFVKGFAEGLGVTERIHSPTFTLVNEYRSGRVPCFHLDLYRLDTAEQILATGLEQYFKPEGAITLIEWFDRAERWIAVTDRLMKVSIEHRTETERAITYENSGD